MMWIFKIKNLLQVRSTDPREIQEEIKIVEKNE